MSIIKTILVLFFTTLIFLSPLAYASYETCPTLEDIQGDKYEAKGWHLIGTDKATFKAQARNLKQASWVCQGQGCDVRTLDTMAVCLYFPETFKAGLIKMGLPQPTGTAWFIIHDDKAKALAAMCRDDISQCAFG